MGSVTIVVVNYRTPGDMARFCHSLAQNPPSGPWSATLVNVCPTPVDSDATNHAVAYLLAAGATEAVVQSHRENIGYARACNHAGAEAKPSDYLAFFNADVILTAGAIDGCVAALDAHPDWGVLGPRQIDDNRRITHGGIFGTRQAPAPRGWHQADAAAFSDVRTDAVTVSGAAYFLRRQLWDELTDCVLYLEGCGKALLGPPEGAFLPTQHYFEETYLSYHATEHGYKVVYYGPICIVHRWHQASPVGGWAETQFPLSKALFVIACDVHSIPHN